MEALDRLTPAQREILQNYQAITNTDDLDTAVAVLESHGWDLQASVQSMFDDLPAEGAGHEEDGEALADTNGIADAGTHDAGGLQRQTITLWDLFTFPVTIPLRIAWAMLSFAASFLPSALRPSILSPSATQHQPAASRSDPKAAAARFLLNFEQAYGQRHPDFFQGTYAQALQKAKNDVRYMLVYLHSAEHDDTERFCRNTLASEALSRALAQRNLLVWAGDIRETEAFQVSNILQATRYPFMAVIAPNQTRLEVVERLEGPKAADEIIASVTRVIERTDPQLAAIRAERQAREQARLIREQQDEAYQASLRADREKARRAQEEREREERERLEAEKREQARIARLEAKKARKERLLATLPEEPPADIPDLAKLSIRLPNGERIVRRFLATNTVQTLYDFVETRDLAPLDPELDFLVVGMFPRKVYNEMDETLEEVGLVPSGTLVVEEKIEDVEE